MVSDQAWGQDRWMLAKFHFCVFKEWDGVKFCKQRLTCIQPSRPNKLCQQTIYWIQKDHYFLTGHISRHDGTILPTWVANLKSSGPLQQKMLYLIFLHILINKMKAIIWKVSCQLIYFYCRSVHTCNKYMFKENTASWN